MRRWLTRLAIPTAETEPREALLWVRRVELVTGIGCIGFGLALWSEGWWHWVLVGAGIVGISPWPGARAILRKAERRPEILNRDPALGRRRRRRMLSWLAPLELLSVVGLGYAFGGVGVAVTAGILGGLGILGGAWLVLRMDRSDPKG